MPVGLVGARVDPQPDGGRQGRVLAQPPDKLLDEPQVDLDSVAHRRSVPVRARTVPPAEAADGEGAERAGLGRHPGEVLGQPERQLAVRHGAFGTRQPLAQLLVEDRAALDQAVPEHRLGGRLAQGGAAVGRVLREQAVQGCGAGPVGRQQLRPPLDVRHHFGGQGGAHLVVPAALARCPLVVHRPAQRDQRRLDAGLLPDQRVERVGEFRAPVGQFPRAVEQRAGPPPHLVRPQTVQHRHRQTTDAYAERVRDVEATHRCPCLRVRVGSGRAAERPRPYGEEDGRGVTGTGADAG